MSRRSIVECPHCGSSTIRTYRRLAETLPARVVAVLTLGLSNRVLGTLGIRWWGGWRCEGCNDTQMLR
jgi:hypothetical protein